MVNKVLILKEMGISTWRLKPSEMPSPEIDLSPKTEIKKMDASHPVWTLVVDDISSYSSLFQHIQKTILNFGVEIQIITFHPSINADDIDDSFNPFKLKDKWMKFFRGGI
jgi:hypothetical protein